jgi:hypothetical protein
VSRDIAAGEGRQSGEAPDERMAAVIARQDGVAAFVERLAARHRDTAARLRAIAADPAARDAWLAAEDARIEDEQDHDR